MRYTSHEVPAISGKWCRYKEEFELFSGCYKQVVRHSSHQSNRLISDTNDTM